MGLVDVARSGCGNSRGEYKRCPLGRLFEPALVGRESPDGVVFIVVQAARCELDIAGRDGRCPDGGVSEAPVNRLPDCLCLPWVAYLEALRPLHLPVEPRVAPVS
jgi:hypothetical protein